MKHPHLHSLPNYGIRIGHLAIHDCISDNSENSFPRGHFKVVLAHHREHFVLCQNQQIRNSSQRKFKSEEATV